MHNTLHGCMLSAAATDLNEARVSANLSNADISQRAASELSTGGSLPRAASASRGEAARAVKDRP